EQQVFIAPMLSVEFVRLVPCSVYSQQNKSGEIGSRQDRNRSKDGFLASIFDAVFGSILAIFYAANMRNRALILRYFNSEMNKCVFAPGC
ncbi:MAG: hypothetical protein V4634_13160, partial [Pseudomonadota bacterium]